jgi:hypothetical protein
MLVGFAHAEPQEAYVFYLDYFYVNFYFNGDKNDAVIFYTAERPAFPKVHFWGGRVRDRRITDHLLEYTTAKQATSMHGPRQEVRVVRQLPGSLEGFSIALLLKCQIFRNEIFCAPPSDLTIASQGGSCENSTNVPSRSNRYSFGIKNNIHPLHVTSIDVKKMPRVMLRGCNCEQKFPYEKAEIDKLLPGNEIEGEFYHGGNLLKLIDRSYLGAFYHFKLSKQIFVGDNWDFEQGSIDNWFNEDAYKYIIDFPSLPTVDGKDEILTPEQLKEKLTDRR